MTDQEILDKAPEGATHVGTDKPIFYYKINELVTEYFAFGVWLDACSTIHADEGIRSLADIRRIVELEKSLAALVQIHKNHYGLDGAWDVELVKAEKLLKGGE